MALLQFLKHMWGYGNSMLIIEEKAIARTHAPDGEKVDVRPLQKYINEILMPSAISSVEGTPRDKVVDEPDSQLKAFLDIPEPCYQEFMTEIVPRITTELWGKCSGQSDVKKKTVALFKLLSRYSWEVKVVLAMAAFGIIYRDSSLTAKNTDPIRSLVDAIIILTNTTMEIDDSTHIRTAVSWNIGSLVVCTSQIIGLDGRYTDDDLSKLTENVVRMNTQLGQLPAEKKKLGADAEEEIKQFKAGKKKKRERIKAYRQLKGLILDLESYSDSSLEIKEKVNIGIRRALERESQ